MLSKGKRAIIPTINLKITRDNNILSLIANGQNSKIYYDLDNNEVFIHTGTNIEEDFKGRYKIDDNGIIFEHWTKF
jgi:hypothetical protein